MRRLIPTLLLVLLPATASAQFNFSPANQVLPSYQTGKPYNSGVISATSGGVAAYVNYRLIGPLPAGLKVGFVRPETRYGVAGLYVYGVPGNNRGLIIEIRARDASGNTASRRYFIGSGVPYLPVPPR